MRAWPARVASCQVSCRQWVSLSEKARVDAVERSEPRNLAICGLTSFVHSHPNSQTDPLSGGLLARSKSALAGRMNGCSGRFSY